MAKVLYEKRNRIGYITLNRPDALNALDDELNSDFGQSGTTSRETSHWM